MASAPTDIPPPGRPPGPAWPWALFWLLAGAGARALFLVHPFIDSDMAVVGLMALHALEGELTPLYWGQGYGGSLEALAAAAVFALFGAGPRALNAAPALLSLVHMAAVYLMGRELLSRRGALAALALASLPSYYLLWYSTSARGLHAALLALGGAFLWLCLRLLRTAPASAAYDRLGLALGLAAGVGFWNNLLMAYFLAPALALLWWRHPRLPLSKAGLFMALGFLLGSSPLWCYNLTHNWDTFHFVMQGRPSSGLAHGLGVFFNQALPVLMGTQQDQQGTWLIPGLSQAALVLSGLAGALALFHWGGSLFKRLRRLPGADGSELLLLSLVSTVLMYAWIGGADMGSHRYLLALHLLWPLAAGWAFQSSDRRQGWPRTLAMLGLALLLASNIAGAIKVSPLVDRAVREKIDLWNGYADGVTSFFAQGDYRYVYCENYWLAPLCTFWAKEQVIYAMPVADRRPQYLRELLRQERCAWVTHESHAPLVRETLLALGARFQTAQVAEQFTAFLEITPPAEDHVQTVWSHRAPPGAGPRLEIDLGQEVRGVCQVMLRHGRADGQPPGLEVLASRDGQGWRRIKRLKERLGPAVWERGKPRLGLAEPWDELRFAPTDLRYLRLEAAVEDQGWSWSVAEARVGSMVQAEP